MKLTDNPIGIAIQYICVLFLTFCAVGLIVSDFLFVWFIAIFIWLFIPAVVVSCISFITSLKCNCRHKKILLILNIINILLFLFPFFNPSGKCNADIMETHYNEYAERILQIHRNLYDKMRPECYVHIEFENGDVSMFHFSNGSGEVESNWDPSEEKIDSLLTQSGLDRKSLAWLENELDKIGCISISMQAAPGNPFCIGFRRVGMGMYSFRFYDYPLSSEEQDSINACENLIVFNDSTVFVYGSGAFGSLNFPGKEEYQKKKLQIHHDTDQ